VTLYITPVYYVYLDRFQRKVNAWRSRRKGKTAEGAVNEPELIGHHD
jgi:hypothetical protein